MRFGRAMLVVSIVAVVLLAAGCGQQQEPPAPGPSETPAVQTPAPAPAAPSGPKTGGRVTLGLWSEPSNFNPLIWETYYDQHIHRLVFNSLVKPNAELEITPDLAEKWEFSADGRTVTFTLRQGVTWHDGQPFTAEDVAFTFTSLAHPLYDGGQYSRVAEIVGAEAMRSGEAGTVEGIKVIDPHKISITTVKASASIMISILQTRIVPKHILGVIPPDQWSRHEFNTESPIGTGPFKFVKYETGQFIEFSANTDFFQGSPKIDQLIVRIGDQNSMLAAFMNKEVDVVQVPIAEVDGVRELDFVEIMTYDQLSYQYVGYNLRNPAFADIKVRRAMAHAINKKQIVNSLLSGYAQTINAPFPPFVWAYPSDLEGYDYDPARAKALLDEAGWTVDPATNTRTKGDQKMVFELVYPTGNLVRMQYAPIVQQNLEAVGIKVELRAADFPTLVSMILPRDEKGSLRPINATDFDIYLLGNNVAPGDPSILLRFFHGQHEPPPGHNYMGYHNDRVDYLFDESAVTVDFAKRKEMANELMRIMADELPVIPLYSDKDIWAVNTRLSNFDPGPHGVTHNIIEWWVD